MPLPAIAAVVGRVAAKAVAGAVVKKALAPSPAPQPQPRPGHAALSQNQFPESPPWGV